MAKVKERSELESLRAENKKMKSELRHLKKEVARKTKRAHLYEDLEAKIADQHVQDIMEEHNSIRKDLCPECSCPLEQITLGNRVMVSCTSCTYRITKKG
jgi:predicted nuclease with TOPRIM domain